MEVVSSTKEAESLARTIRTFALKATSVAGSSHIGSCLSVADILAVIYSDAARVAAIRAASSGRDIVILSKGHAAAALYGALAGVGLLASDSDAEFCRAGSALLGHASHHVPGVEFSTGSLGHGLPLAVGAAIGKSMRMLSGRVLCVLSDGECDEGSTWEAAMVAGHRGLSNLVAVVDNNRLQSFGRTDEVLRLEPIEESWQLRGWSTIRVDGHDLVQVRNALAMVVDRPLLIVADTTKGKGVPYMEDRLEWHYRSVAKEDLPDALALIGAKNA